MRHYRDFEMAKAEAGRRARKYTKSYYVAQDARRPLQHFAIVTRLQLLKSRHLLPATYVARPELKILKDARPRCSCGHTDMMHKRFSFPYPCRLCACTGWEREVEKKS